MPAAALAALRDRTHVRPGAGSLTISQDRLWEKQLFGRVGVPCAAFGDIDTPDQLDDALARTGLPAVIKTKRMGYDGKGQRVVRTAEEARSAVGDLGDELIAEALIGFRRELSLVLVRSVDRETVFYPLVENVHVDGILSTTVAPAPESTRRCRRHARATAGRSPTRSTTSACSASSSSRPTRACSRTSSHRASTTRATGRSRVRRRASSRTTCARCSASRSGRPRRVGGR